MNFKRVSTYIGRVVVALCLIYIFITLKDLDFSKLIEFYDISWIFKALFLSTLFCFIYLFNASAWADMIEIVSNKDPRSDAKRVYLKTVIYKYLPGNIFHFLGRHSLSKDHNISHKEILMANSFEIIMLLFSVLFWLMIGSLFFEFKIDIFSYITLDQNKLLMIFLSIFVTLGIFIYYKGYQKSLFNLKTINIFFKNSLFLLGSSLIFISIFTLFFNYHYSVVSFFNMIFIALIAWLLGFVIPGAPGGIGIRESIYILMVPPLLGVDVQIVTVVALIYRVITIVGESMTLVLAKIFEDKY